MPGQCCRPFSPEQPGALGLTKEQLDMIRAIGDAMVAKDEHANGESWRVAEEG